MLSPVANLLSDLGDGLREIGAPWYLFGARAAILYGVARLTADVESIDAKMSRLCTWLVGLVVTALGTTLTALLAR